MLPQKQISLKANPAAAAGSECFFVVARLSFPRLYPFAHCSCWQHITAWLCECDKEDLALEMHTVCEIPNESSKGMDESYQVLLSHPMYRLRKTS